MQDPMFSTPAAEIRRAGVDLNGLMTVLGKHLYSTPMVALRELVQNAHDSIIRRRIEQPGIECASRIDVQIDVAAGGCLLDDACMALEVLRVEVDRLDGRSPASYGLAGGLATRRGTGREDHPEAGAALRVRVDDRKTDVGRPSEQEEGLGGAGGVDHGSPNGVTGRGGGRGQCGTVRRGRRRHGSRGTRPAEGT